MNIATTHEATLAAIATAATTDGIPDADVDAWIADELGVPHDHYVAYLLTWGAIEAYGLTHPDRTTLRLADPDRAGGTAVARLRRLRRVFELAGIIHEAAVAGGDMQVVVRDHARRLIAELVALSDTVLADVDRHQAADGGCGGAA